MQTLFENGCFYTPTGVVTGALLATDGVIAAIGSRAEVQSRLEADVTRVNLGGALVLPGFVNAHGHSAMTLVRGLGSGLPLQRWLNEAIFPVEAKMTPDDIRAGMAMAVLEMLASGTTCVADMYDFPGAGAEVLMQSGMRANICRVGLDFPWAPGTPPNRLEECIDFVRNFKDDSGRVVADFCIHSEYLTREDFVRSLAEANVDFKRPVHVHVSETKREHMEACARHGGLTPIGYLATTGILDQGAYCAHGVWCTDADFAIMRDLGVTLVHNPSSNMKLASGFARIAAALKAGVRVALGTDGCASNDDLDMLEEMRLAALLAKGVTHDPEALPAVQALAMATRAGALALKRMDVGSLEVGMKADFCVLDVSSARYGVQSDFATAVVYAGKASDVVMTVVDGRILYDHGTFTTLDVARVRAQYREAVGRLGLRELVK